MSLIHTKERAPLIAEGGALYISAILAFGYSLCHFFELRFDGHKHFHGGGWSLFLATLITSQPAHILAMCHNT